MLRKGILEGASICVVIVAYSILRYPEILASPAAPIGLAWIVEVFAGNVLMPHSPIGPLVTIVAAVLLVVAGATGAGVTGQAWTGALFCSAAGAFGGLFGRLVRSPRTHWLSH